MSGIERKETVYEERGRDNVPAPPDEPPVDEAPAPDSRERGRGFPLLISIQLILCVAAAAAMFILKAMDSELYHSIMTYYRTEMSRPVVSRELFEAADIAGLTGAKEPSTEASADELPPG